MESVETRLISYSGRIRDADAKRVAALQESIKEVGLLNPITVYRSSVVRAGQSVEGFGLVAGMHRLRACQNLGWTEIPAVIVDLDEHQRVIAECDENLCVAELSPSDRAVFTAKRKEAYLALHPETGHGTPSVSRQVGDTRDRAETPRFTADTAAKTGQSERAVQRDAERGEKVCPQALHLVRGTSLDTGAYLDKIKTLQPQDQIARVRADLKAPKAPRIADNPESDEAALERQVAALMAAWNKAAPEARREFMDRIETPVMERGAA